MALPSKISGVRMGPDVSDLQVAEIRQALLDWKVVFFRDQDVSVEDHVAFDRTFEIEAPENRRRWPALRRELERAVQREQYEEAAQLRDRIRELGGEKDEQSGSA